MDIKKELEKIYITNMSILENLSNGGCSVEVAKAATDLINQRLEILKQLAQLP